MKNQVKLCLKIAWLVAAVSIFFMGTSMCVSSSGACVQAGNAMLSAMVLITFPTGVFFFLVAAIFVDPGSIHQPSDFITAWFIMMCGGLFQWFLIVPSLFEKPGLTTLGLEASATLPSLNPQDVTPVRSQEVIQPAPISNAESPTPASSNTVQVVSNRTRTRRKSIAALDRTGRTPLERVIDHL